MNYNPPSFLKDSDAWREYNRRYWHKRRMSVNFTPQEEKGIPVPRTGKRRWHSGKNSGKTGVIGNSHVVSHRYMDEGDKGPALRREIRRKEQVIVDQEIAEGFSEWLYDGVDGYAEYDLIDCW